MIIFFITNSYLWNCQFSYNHWLVTIKLLSVKHPFQPLQGIFQTTSLFSWSYIPVIIKGKRSYTLCWVTDVEETKDSDVILSTTQFGNSHKFMTRLAFFCNFICLFTRRSWWPIQTNWWNKTAWLGSLPRDCCSVNLSCRWNGTYCKPILTTRMMAAYSATLTFVYYHTSSYSYCSSLVDSQSCKLTELWTPKTFQECLLCEDQLQKRSKHLNQPLNHRLAATV